MVSHYISGVRGGLLLAILVVALAAGFAMGQAQEPLSLEASIPLRNVKGRIDHLAADIREKRLFVAAVANHSVEVIDLQSARRVHSIENLPEPQGVLYEPSTDRLYVACALDGSVRIFDGRTFRLLSTVKFPDDADNLRYDSARSKVVVGYAGAKQLRGRPEGSGGLGFIDLSGKKTSDIEIDAHPESFQIEHNGRRIFVNVPEKNEIEVVDGEKGSVITKWPVSAENNFPMALDEAHHRMFVGCWKPLALLVFDTETGKQTASAEISGKTDDLFYDSDRARIYVLTSQGFLDVFQQRDSDHYGRIARYPTPAGTQTGLFVREWSQLFAAVRQQSDQDAEVRIYRAH